jgi:hypothetical protein
VPSYAGHVSQTRLIHTAACFPNFLVSILWRTGPLLGSARNIEERCFRLVRAEILLQVAQNNSSGPPCGGRVEYLHHDPASRRRRRKGKSQVGDSKIWSRVPRDSGPRKTALARTKSIYKRQTHPLVIEGAPQKQDRNCQRVTKISSHESQMGLDTKIY